MKLDELKAKVAADKVMDDLKKAIMEGTLSREEIRKMGGFDKTPEATDVRVIPEMLAKAHPPAKPGMEGKTGILQVVRIWKEASSVKSESADEELIEVQTFNGIPTASVGFSCRMTLNLGNYETVQIGVNCTVPCYKEEVTEAFEAAKKFVDGKLNSEVSAIRDYRERKKGSKE